MQKPDRKVQAGGLAGGLTIILVWGLKQAGVEVPAEVAAGMATIIGFIVSYFVPNPK